MCQQVRSNQFNFQKKIALWEKVNKKVQAGEDLTDYEKELVLKLLPKTIKTEVGLTHTVDVNQEQLDKAKKAVNEYLNDNQDTTGE